MSQQDKISVAIIGGGLAGVTLFRALLFNPRLQVSIYESRPRFKEEGAGIGIQSNAISSLDAISPDLSKALDQAGAVRTGFTMWLGCGPNAGEQLSLPDTHNGVGKSMGIKNVGRHAFLQQLLSGVSEDSMFASKKLKSIEEHPNSAKTTLVFEDGTSQAFDVVIGADGIHSHVRNYVLGDHPSATPQFADWWHAACLVPVENVLPVLESDTFTPKEPRQHMWIGEKGQCILYDFVDECKAVQCIICVRGDKCYDPKETPNEIARDEILKEYSNWPRNLGHDYVNLICDHVGDPIRCWPQFHHLAAPTYVKNNIALVGDAAHSTTPWQGSGGGMAIEDALVLSRVLEHVKSKAEISSALRAYDKVRRPRTQRVVESSYGTGLLSSGRDVNAGLDKTKLEQALGSRWDFIHDFDPAQHVQEAITTMDQELKKVNGHSDH